VRTAVTTTLNCAGVGVREETDAASIDAGGIGQVGCPYMYAAACRIGVYSFEPFRI
jgi:hypothetical protein